MPKLTDAMVDELDEQGFVIVPAFISGEKLKTLQAAQRRLLPTWEEMKNKPQDQVDCSYYVPFPFEDLDLYKAAMDEESIAFARKWLKTDNIHARVGNLIARYPGHSSGGTGHDASNLHIDNGNNSLLPESKDLREFGQLGFWIHLEDVCEDQAPLRLLPNQYGTDMTKSVPLVCSGGTLCLMTNFTLHSASAYTRKDGQRFTWVYAFGRADHCWEGLIHYTDRGINAPVFQEFIGGLTAAQRELWRFPPAGHPYYTEQTLVPLEAQYPGWNSDEYRAAMNS